MMKISIWQQFSSNHSASFTLVGEFPTVEQAADAADIMRQLMREIAVFLQGLTEDERYSGSWLNREEYRHLPGITPPEKKASEQYGVEWNHFYFDWIPPDPDKAQTAVILLDRSVFIYDINFAQYTRPKPLKEILQKLGAQVASSGELENTTIRLRFSYTAPDDATAESLWLDIMSRYRGEFFSPIPGQSLETEAELPPIRDGLRLELVILICRIDDVFSLIAYLEFLKVFGCTDFQYHYDAIS